MTIYQDYVGAGIQPPVTIQGNPITTDTLASDKAVATIRGSTTITKPNPDADVSPDNVATISGVSNPTISATAGAASNSQRIVADLYRLPNGTFDEYDGQTGRLIKRVGYWVFGGAENWLYNSPYSSNTHVTIASPDYRRPDRYNEICTHFERVADWTKLGLATGFLITESGLFLSVDYATIGVTAGSADSEKLAAAKTYLTAQSTASTPVTIYYELANPVITEVTHDLSCYDSTTTFACEGVPPGNMDITICDGRTVGKARDADLLAGIHPSAYLRGNPNLLDNWDFRDPVNQRGLTEYTESGYTIDRWRQYYTGMQTQIGDGYITIRGLLDHAASFFSQGIKAKGISGLITFTAILRGPAGKAGRFRLTGSYGTSSYFKQALIPYIGSWQAFQITANLTNPVDFLWVYLYPDSGTEGLSADYKAAKLELGPVSTLHLDPPADYGTELAKCQRYQFVSKDWFRVTPTNIDVNHIDFFIPLPVTPRIAPTAASITSQINDGKIMVKANGDVVTGFACTLAFSPGNGLQIRLAKNNHGLTTNILLEIGAAVFDFNL